MIFCFLHGTGILAILVRQTSIVWTVFVAVSSLDASLQHHLLSQKERNNSEVLSSWRQLQVYLVTMKPMAVNN